MVINLKLNNKSLESNKIVSKMILFLLCKETYKQLLNSKIP